MFSQHLYSISIFTDNSNYKVEISLLFILPLERMVCIDYNTDIIERTVVHLNAKQFVQSVPNFSEGRDLRKVEQIVDAFRAKPNLRLLDYSTDPDLNRCVVTVVGEPEAIGLAMIEAIGTAVDVIDLTIHEGQHPRIGAVDVVPFIPLKNCTIQDADNIARYVAEQVGLQFGLPTYLYDYSATATHREDLAAIRKGQFEGLEQKMQNPLWKPDFGPSTMHPTAGATVIGARHPLVYFNINLDTPNVEIARKIAHRVRHSGGGYRHVKAMGIAFDSRNLAQVSLNMTNFSKTSLYSAFEAVKCEAQRYGVRVVSSEMVGLVPMQALIDCAEYYLQIEDFSMDQVLENHIL